MIREKGRIRAGDIGGDLTGTYIKDTSGTFCSASPDSVVGSDSELLVGSEPSDTEERASGEAVAEMLEHDADLPLDELVDNTFEDVLERTELQLELDVANPELAFDKLPIPSDANRLGDMRISSQVTFNFSSWVARRELKRFARRLEKWNNVRVVFPLQTELATHRLRIAELESKLSSTRWLLIAVLVWMFVFTMR